MNIEKGSDDDNSEQDRLTMEKSDDPNDEKSQSNNDSDTDSNASSEYEVEKILGKRKRRRGGGYEYYIKWVGYDDSANEWIPESSLNCPERVAEFERDVKRQKQRQQQKRDSRRSRNSRRNSTRVQKRRVNILDDDDDDDDNQNDGNVTVKDHDVEDEMPKSVDTSISSSSKSTIEKKTDQSEIRYGVDKGYKVQAVLGINRTKGDQLYYLVHYQSPTSIEDNMELIPSSIAKKFCEDEIIQFYETRITWNEHQTD